MCSFEAAARRSIAECHIFDESGALMTLFLLVKYARKTNCSLATEVKKIVLSPRSVI